MRTFGLIGYPLVHSFSARHFAQKFAAEGIEECEYRLFEIENIEQLPGLLERTPGLCGFNVTIPYKQQVIPYLDSLSDGAAAIGAVNCVKVEGGRLRGYNTDALGFRNSLLELLGGERPAALVLGTGGASKAVCYVLRTLGMEYDLVSRRTGAGNITYADIDEKVMNSHKLIVNTTPLGTYPATESCPELPYAMIGPGHRLFDLVYNPPLTEFLRRGREQGARIMNGARMLFDQAEESWRIWNGCK